MQQVTVRVPASTSNLGPGYDCLGVALRIYNHVTIRCGRSARVEPIAAAAAARFFQRASVDPFAFQCEIRGDVPLSRGLGSSATVRVGVITALNEIAARPLSRQQIFEICAELETHPDNAAPALFGGFNILATGARQRFSVSARLKFVLLIPNFEVRTEAARRLLPREIKHRDAVANAGNVARIVAAFASCRYAELRGAFVDHLHQPFRKRLVPFFDRAIAAAESAGALGAFLSGSGSAIAAVTLNQPQPVARAMLAAAGEGDARTIITSADNRGAHIVAA